MSTWLNQSLQDWGRNEGRKQARYIVCPVWYLRGERGRGRAAGLISISGVCLSSFTLSLSVFTSLSRLTSLVSGYTLLMIDLDLDLGLALFSELLLVLDPIINFSLGRVRS